jgi:hypothetical protein
VFRNFGGLGFRVLGFRVLGLGFRVYLGDEESMVILEGNDAISFGFEA